ncbi:MAG TPA: histidinol dehydrogenase [Thermoanaerobaculia bacterium]|nr:histidinol dehydrogenase [Thermoanaerobaculia bacterium]
MERTRLTKSETDNWLTDFRARRSGEEKNARAIAAAIIARVEAGGDAGICRLLAEIDGVEMAPGELLVRPDGGSIEPALERAVRLAIERVTAYHELQRPASTSQREGDLELQTVPLDRVGIYVPGGAAVYLSTLVMCAVPARIAGVRELVVATTPRVAGMPEFRWACSALGVDEVVRAGGATGIAALAIGTESVRPVQKIVGPGNAYVNEAKKLLRDRVGIDLPAGPSEIVVIADASGDAPLIAADMLAQAEHGPDSLAICLTDSEVFATRLEGEIERRLTNGAERAKSAIDAFGAILVVDDLDGATALADAIAPEHLAIQVTDPEPVVARIRNCAAIFVGEASAVALGDYVAGSNHVLPTGGTAAFCSSLSVSDFVQRRSIVRISEKTLAEIGPAAVTFAEYEGLSLHADSVKARLGRLSQAGNGQRGAGRATDSREDARPPLALDFIPAAIRAMSAYTLEPRVARDKLDQNESAYDVPAEIKRRVVDRMAARPWNQYPDFEAVAIRDALAARAGVTRDSILVGNGSNELLMVTMATLVRAGTRVVIPAPTFPLYEKFATIFEADVTRVPIDPRSGRLPVDRMFEAVRSSDRPAVAIVCSPNNPTGGALAGGELERLLDSGAFVIFDRAYGEFCDSGAPSPRERLVVLSTLSKAWGLASLRVGWLLATAEICREIRKVKLPYNLNAFSQEAALALLEESDLIARQAADTVRERDRVAEALGSIEGIEVFPSHANFLTFRVSGSADDVFERLNAKGILVRNVSHAPGLERCLRASMGTTKQNNGLVNAMRGNRE